MSPHTYTPLPGKKQDMCDQTIASMSGVGNDQYTASEIPRRILGMLKTAARGFTDCTLLKENIQVWFLAFPLHNLIRENAPNRYTQRTCILSSRQRIQHIHISIYHHVILQAQNTKHATHSTQHRHAQQTTVARRILSTV